jgi:hypothetical protein
VLNHLWLGQLPAFAVDEQCVPRFHVGLFFYLAKIEERKALKRPVVSPWVHFVAVALRGFLFFRALPDTALMVTNTHQTPITNSNSDKPIGFLKRAMQAASLSRCQQ